ncbi:hypothetical protein N431DRAFT_430928 [Stipitochalara longipes BDJ]|nr:hypothetical protein N431DRAFT_430928 [Stipitochalara longipes BDJ]
MPVEPISLAIGTGLAVGGILLSFKGAVDGYLLLNSFFDKDNGLLDLAIRYHLQLKILEVWGSRCSVDSATCALYELPDDTQNIIANTLARIASLNEEAKAFLDIHEGNNAIVASNISVNQLQPGSAEISAVSEKQKQNKVKAKKVIKWTIKKKGKFTEVVDKLERYNDQLLKFLSPRLTQTFNITLPSYALAGISDHETIERLQSLEEKYFRISHAAKLKALQESTQAIKKTATILNGNDTKLISQTTAKAASQTCRDVGYYENVRKIWVEWRDLEPNLSIKDDAEIRERIKTLSGMLSAVTIPDLRIPPFLGIVEDDAQALQGGRARRGFTYETPSKYSTASPVSLLHMINDYKVWEPALGEKFKLAATIAISLDLLHSSEWLHKSFRSDNILFFQHRTTPSSNTSPSSILDPWITGFEYARVATSASIGYRPDGKKDLDYYYHPDVVKGFTKAQDLYSLGVVLLEIAMWRPLSTKIPVERKQDLKAIRDVFLEHAKKKLPSEMGDVYADVVILCLDMSLEGLNDVELAGEVSNNVITKLQYCRA